MAVVAARACYKNRSKYRVHEQTTRDIHGKIRWARRIGELVCLSELQHTEKVDGTSKQRRQFCQLPDVAQLSEKVLVCEQFICVPGYETLRTAQRERGYACSIPVAASAIQSYENRGGSTQPEEILSLDFSNGKCPGRRRIDCISLRISQEIDP